MAEWRTINGFRLAPWASDADVAWARSHQIDVRRSAASQNWGASNPVRPSDAVVYASSASVSAIPPAPYQTPHYRTPSINTPTIVDTRADWLRSRLPINTGPARQAYGTPAYTDRSVSPGPGWQWQNTQYYDPEPFPNWKDGAFWPGAFSKPTVRTPGQWVPPGQQPVVRKHPLGGYVFGYLPDWMMGQPMASWRRWLAKQGY